MQLPPGRYAGVALLVHEVEVQMSDQPEAQAPSSDALAQTVAEDEAGS